MTEVLLGLTYHSLLFIQTISPSADNEIELMNVVELVLPSQSPIPYLSRCYLRLENNNKKKTQINDNEKQAYNLSWIT